MFKVSPASLQTFIDPPNCIVEIKNTMHKFAALLYSHMLPPRCFGSSLPSSGSFWICLELRENTDRYGGLSNNVVKWPACLSVCVNHTSV
jgi:hypothetical protein